MNAYRWLLDKFKIGQGSTYADPSVTLRQSAAWIDEYIQTKITDGELMVLNNVCKDRWCGTRIGSSMKYCPGCGTEINE